MTFDPRPVNSAAGRDGFPNNYVGDLVETDRGWVVVAPTCCPDLASFPSALAVSGRVASVLVSVVSFRLGWAHDALSP
jgi:hypothetical protein